MGRLCHRDGRGGRGRGDHDRGHAAEQHPAHGKRGRAGRQAGRGRGPACGGRRVLGRRHPRQPGRPAGAARSRRGRVQMLPAAVRSGRVPAARSRAARRGHGRDRQLRRPGHRARRGPSRDRRRASRTRPPLPRLPGLPAARGRGTGDRGPAGPHPPHRLPHPRSAPVQCRDTAGHPGGQSGRAAGHRGNLSALPHAAGRARSSSAARRSGARPTAPRCGTACRTGPSTAWSPTTRRAPSS
jgi:hypothetical protein